MDFCLPVVCKLCWLMWGMGGLSDFGVRTQVWSSHHTSLCWTMLTLCTTRLVLLPACSLHADSAGAGSFNTDPPGYNIGKNISQQVTLSE